MTKENPPISQEGAVEQLHHETEITAEELQHKQEAPSFIETSEDKERNLTIAKMEAETAYAKSKNTEERKLKGDDVWTMPKMDTKPHSKLRNAYMGARIALAGLLGLSTVGAKAHEGTPNDSTKNKIESIETDYPTKHKPFQQKEIGEIFGHLTLEGSISIPQSDTTKEFEAFYFTNDGKQEHKIGAIIEIMTKKGYHPANEQQLRAIYDQNKTAAPFNKRQLSSLIAPTPIGSPDDTRANERRILEKDGTIQVVLPENSVFPTRNTEGLGKYEIDHELPDDYGFIFFKNVDKK